MKCDLHETEYLKKEEEEERKREKRKTHALYIALHSLNFKILSFIYLLLSYME